MKLILKISTSYALLLLVGATIGNVAVGQNIEEQGKLIFNQKAVPACSFCHSLKHADSMAESGPDLDSLQPNAQMIENAVRHGKGEMPAIKGLSDDEIKILVRYLVSVTGKK